MTYALKQNRASRSCPACRQHTSLARSVTSVELLFNTDGVRLALGSRAELRFLLNLSVVLPLLRGVRALALSLSL